MVLRVLLVAISYLLVGCESARFYGQAISGQVGLLANRVGIDKVRKGESLSSELRGNLDRVQDLKNFAATHLALEPNGSYDTYVSLDRDYVAWNVAICDEFSLEPRSWWYPIVGRLEHRAYFSEQSAHRYAERMRARGWEVAVGGVPAYSTLGWFRDPVLSTFWQLSEVELAELLFHELSHQRVFLPGDTDFNEAFAVAVGEAGVIRWLKSRGQIAELRDYRNQIERQDELMDWVAELRADLEESFQRGEINEWTLAERRSDKTAILRSARERFRQRVEKRPDLAVYSSWVEGPLNNAEISVIDTYYRLLPGFRRRIERNPELAELYRWVKSLEKVSKRERLERLEAGQDFLVRSSS